MVWICVGASATWRHTYLADQLILPCTLIQLALLCMRPQGSRRRLGGLTPICQALGPCPSPPGLMPLARPRPPDRLHDTVEGVDCAHQCDVPVICVQS